MIVVVLLILTLLRGYGAWRVVTCCSSSVLHFTDNNVVIERRTQDAVPPEDINISAAEMSALEDFYYSMDGENWSWYSSDTFGRKWNFTANANPCIDQWQGIACLPPASPYTFRYISEINLVEFNLVGTIPESIATLAELKRLIVPSNRIHGTLPEAIGNLTLLSFLEINNNHLTGSIPESIKAWKDIQIMYLDYNLFSTTVPEFLGSLHSLNYLYIDGNFFHGSVPASLGNLSEILGIDISSNRLTGTIPAELGQLSRLKYLALNFNRLTGTLPYSLGRLQLLELLDLTGNHLQGAVPASMGNWTRLQFLYMDHNTLSGTLPSSIGALTKLVYLTLNCNQLWGTVPTAIVQLAALQVLLLYQNSLSGPLTGLFDPEVHTKLQTVQVNDNRFTGYLPAELFQLPQLNSLIAGSNCLNPYLPATVCNNTHIDSIVLDGLGSASSCRQAIFPNIPGSAYTVAGSDSSIPACLYSLANVTTLHLSGNGYQGSLPADASLSPFLVDLSLSHNRLTGSIPLIYQRRKWYSLDLSYNRFSGSLNVEFQSAQIDLEYYTVVNGLVHFDGNGTVVQNVTKRTLTPTISLENNRISGRIPSSLLSMTDVSILGSNVFSCNLQGSNLPKHDSGKNNYQCGSDSFDIPYYLWLSLVLVCGTPVLYVWMYSPSSAIVSSSVPRDTDGSSIIKAEGISISTSDSMLSQQAEKLSENMRKWLNYSYEDPNVKAGLYVFNQMIDIIWFSTLRCLLFTLLVLLPTYALLSVFYGRLVHPYAWTVSAAYLSGRVPVAVETPLLLLLLALFLFSCITLIRSVTREVYQGERQFSVIVHRRVPLVRKIALFVCANIVVVVGVNVSYVYIAIYESSALLTFAQVLLSIFKIVWNGVCTSNMLRSRTMYAEPGDQVHAETEFAALQVFLTLLNNIVIPCMVVAVISPSCFYNVFVAAPDVSAPFTYDICFLTNEDEDCVIYLPTLSTASYSPPFIYNYQCSSSLITYYAPAFVILCMVRSIATPLMQGLLYKLHRAARRGSRWHAILDSLLPPVLQPISAGSSVIAKRDGHTFALPVGTFFDATRVLITMVSYLGLLLTFGAMFPPLAVALALTVFVIAYTTKLGLGRFLTIAMEQHLLQYLQLIERECRLVASVSLLHSSLWMLLTVSCWFYTLFLFDTLGDAVGFEGAYWVLIVMPLMPLVMYGVYRSYRHWQLREAFRRREQAADQEFALSDPAQDHDGTFNVLVGAGQDAAHELGRPSMMGRGSLIELKPHRAAER